VLTAVLMHFVELEHELELLGSRYNTNLTEGKLEAFWWVPPSVAHNPPGGAGVGGSTSNSLIVFAFLSLSCKLWDSN
jgi:hypothetical protein